ncbi:MAG: serine hydrolase domain-containing protein [Sandaracinaceae bacterium]
MALNPRGRVRAHAARLLAAGVSGRVFPGAVAAIVWRENGEEHEACAAAGTREPNAGGKIAEDTMFDLGAITRSVVGVAALRAHEAGLVDLEAQVEALLPHVRGGILGEVTLRMLLEHRGGLAAWGGLYLDVPHDPGSVAARRWLLSEAARRDAEGKRGTHVVSDLGYLVAGAALAKAYGASLADVVAAEVAGPLGLGESLMYPGALMGDRRAAFAARAAPTERCGFRGRLMVGEVQDENAWAYGGVAGHAGLFATASALARLGSRLASAWGDGSELMRSEVLREALTPDATGTERYGIARVSGDPPACGRRMGPGTFGQLGLPGTSLFFDPESQVTVALLTNRICPSRANQMIEGFRPAFHDGVLAAIDG